MTLQNIPPELRALRQWICWRWQERDGGKPTKLPFCPTTGRLASVTEPRDWVSFEEACAAAPAYDGIGFVFTRNDPFCGIDLDDTHGDGEAYARQVKVFEQFNSYSELSPSGRGLHIICRATLPGPGRRRASIEMYDTERYFTFTGNVFRAAPIAERQELAELLYEQMGGPVQTYVYGQDQTQTHTDEQILEFARNAANGDKFQMLFEGNWSNLYPSQSEADFALVDIIAYYTQNRAQIVRLFRQSVLGLRDKAKRDPYIGYMVEKSFDRQLPPIDIDGLKIAFEKSQAARLRETERKTATAPVAQPSDQNGADCRALEQPQNVSTFPPGLIGEIAEFILQAAPRPVPQIALCGAIGLLAGITGRAYNVSGTGLNQYVLMIAKTGRGKEAIAGGISKLMETVKQSVPSVLDFVGPTEIASSQALLKWLARNPAIYSVVGEFGIKLKEMSMPHANPNVAGLKRTLLDLYNKSGRGNVQGAMAYSKREDNTAVVTSPCFTLIGESTPSRFFENVNEDIVGDGLLPRFMVIDYDGPRVAMNDLHKLAMPSLNLVQKLAELSAYCLSLGSTGKTCEVGFSPEAKAIFDSFNAFCDRQINNEKVSEVAHELWNRAHIKAMKLAALYAVGCNYLAPIITAEQAQRATDEIYGQTNSLKSRFDNGEVGGGAVNPIVNDAKQMQSLIKIISNLTVKKLGAKAHAYRISEDMQNDKVFPFNSLLMHAQIYPVFKNDRRGSSEAIRKIYQQLLDNDDLREIPKQEMQKRYGKSCRAFCISNPDKFLADAD